MLRFRDVLMDQKEKLSTVYKLNQNLRFES